MRTSPAAIEILTRQQRRRQIADSESAQGLDSVSARAIDAAAGLYELALSFVPPSGAPAESYEKLWRPKRLTPANVLITGPGGGMVVESVHHPHNADPILVRARTKTLPADLRPLLSPVYTLRFHGVPDLDPFFAKADFFLPSRQTPDGAVPALPGSAQVAAAATPSIDYLCKDYLSFRKLMLDNMTLWDPTWRERNPADLGVVIVEALAYAADYLSYFQDAAATEAYLFTAWRRTSVRRHARLAGYRMHEGCSARVWIHIAVNSRVELPRSAQFATGQARTLLPGVPPEPAATDSATLRIFESITAKTLEPQRNGIPIYTWGVSESQLPAGALSATLDGGSLNLRCGDTIIFEMAEINKDGVIADDGMPGPRHAIRLSNDPIEEEDHLYGRPVTRIEWFPEDALPCDMLVRALGQGPVRSTVARANVVLADMGQSVGPFALPIVPERGLYRPRLEHTGITYAETWNPHALGSASSALQQDPNRALPCVSLFKYVPGLGNIATWWAPMADLLSSNGYDRHFVVEVETGGACILRFGDGQLGRRPSRLTQLFALYRVGDGTRGNIGPDTLTSLFSTNSAITSVRNPMAAAGGCAFENLQAARLAASSLATKRLRAVTPKDYTYSAKENPEVNSAVMRRHSIGSWDLDVLYVQRRNGFPVDRKFARAVEACMEPYRMLGRIIRVVPPRFVAIRIALAVEAAPRILPARVRNALADKFRSGLRATGERGFFHPDNFRLGQPLYLSAVIAAAMEIEGVRSASVTRFEAAAGDSAESLKAGVIEVESNQVIRLLNNPSEPENGQISFDVQGDR